MVGRLAWPERKTLFRKRARGNNGHQAFIRLPVDETQIVYTTMPRIAIPPDAEPVCAGLPPCTRFTMVDTDLSAGSSRYVSLKRSGALAYLPRSPNAPTTMR